jgi:hypothetical protein
VLRLILAVLIAHTQPMAQMPSPLAFVPRQDSTQYWVFLDHLASVWTPAAMNSGYEPAAAQPFEVPVLVALVADSGLTFRDYQGPPWHLSKTALSEELVSREGTGFDMLLHVGYMRASPGYGDLRIVAVAGGVLVHVGGWYDLLLVPDGQTYRVASVTQVACMCE